MAALWSQVDPVATVTQIVGVDAYGLIRMIAQRAETVRRNRYKCRQLAQHAETIGGLLQQVQRKHPEIDVMVEKLEATLREACVLVSSCQGSSYFRRFIQSGRQAQQFQRIKDKIDFYLQLFPVISHIDTTRRLNILLDGVQSPQTQNMPRSSSSRSGRPPSRSIGNEDERPHANTEPFAVRRDDSAVTQLRASVLIFAMTTDGKEEVRRKTRAFLSFQSSQATNMEREPMALRRWPARRTRKCQQSSTASMALHWLLGARELDHQQAEMMMAIN